MANNIIKVGYLISYDYAYLKYSLPTVYKHADVIYLAIDKDRLTWKGKSFEIEDSFFEWIKEYDTANKIHIYEDTFYVSELSPMDCDTRERNMLAKEMGEGGWHVQIDTDEYYLDFEGFTNHLKSLNIKKTTALFADWITIFKQDKQDTFYIDNAERFPAATNKPLYTSARNIARPYKKIKTKFKVLHQSWGRSDEELEFKLNNWSHTNDFDAQSYFNFWKAINRYTYKFIQNFHPLSPKVWKSLECVEAKDMPTLIEVMRKKGIDKEKKSFFSRLIK